MSGDIRRVEVGLLEHPLRVIVTALEDRASPLSQQLLRHLFDAPLRALALGVENDHLADSAGDQGILLDRKLGQRGQQIALNVVSGHGTIVQGLEEESNGLQEIDFRVNQGVGVLVAVKEHDHLR